MVLTVTINPLLERRFIYGSIVLGDENRNGKNLLKAGGKGINVSRQLNYLNTESLAFTFLGGNNGRTFADVLREEKIKFTTSKTKSETREAAVIVEQSSDSIHTFFGANSYITSGEINEFKVKLEKMIQNCEIVLFAGSSPCAEADSIFPFGIEAANKYDKISVLDTYGSHLSSCLNAGPTIVHNNISEVEKSLGIKLNTIDEKIQYLNDLYKKGVKQSFITNGSETAVCADFDYHYKIETPEVKVIDSTGSGDSFTAGIIYSLYNDLTFEQSLILASALGTVNAEKYETCTATLKEIETVEKLIKITSIGKKMKTVDVTPR